MTRKRLLLIILIIAIPILFVTVSGDNETGGISETADPSDNRLQSAGGLTRTFSAEKQKINLARETFFESMNIESALTDLEIDSIYYALRHRLGIGEENGSVLIDSLALRFALSESPNAWKDPDHLEKVGIDIWPSI